MKDSTFETKIVAAGPPQSDHTNTFVTATMRRIKQGALAARLPQPQKREFVFWLQHLHKPTLALLAIIAITLLSSAVYAAVHFAPAFIQLLGKQTNPRGATEYSVAGFAACSTMYNPVDRFEVKAEAGPLSDEEVQKILQARCETQWLQQFPGTQWPTYGTNGEWQDGDTIYYARLDTLGTIANINGTEAGIVMGGRTVPHMPPVGEKIKAFAAGKEVPLESIRPGDTVFAISRVSEIYRKPNLTAPTKEEGLRQNAMNNINDGPPKVVGLLAVFKLSLPLEYYLEKQNYLTEIPECFGNAGELCPNTASVDIYPLASGEGAQNPYRYDAPDAMHREISGTVTELSDDTLTLKSRSGKAYTVTVGDAGFTVYNRNFAGFHTNVDATLKVGSRVAIRYVQAQNADPTKIAKEHVWHIVLQLESVNPKKGNIKQY